MFVVLLHHSITVGIADLSAAERVLHTVGCYLSSLRHHFVCVPHATVNCPVFLNRPVCLHVSLIHGAVIKLRDCHLCGMDLITAESCISSVTSYSMSTV